MGIIHSFQCYWCYAPIFDLSLSKINSGNWRNLDNEEVTRKQTFKYGDRIYVVALAASSSGQMCPIANFTCQIFNQYPMTTDELKTAGQNTRLNSYLDDHYRSVNTISLIMMMMNRPFWLLQARMITRPACLLNGAGEAMALSIVN